jgi:hypothetical protein
LRLTFGFEIVCAKCQAPLRLIALVKNQDIAKSVTSTYPSSPSTSSRFRLADPALAAQAGASVVGAGFLDAEIPPSRVAPRDSSLGALTSCDQPRARLDVGWVEKRLKIH